MKAVLEDGTVVTVEVLSKRKKWFGFGKEECLVQYKGYIHEGSKELYSKIFAEWVPSSMVFD